MITSFSEKIEIPLDRSHVVHKVHLHGVVEVHNATHGAAFKVNGHHLKPYHEYLRPEME